MHVGSVLVEDVGGEDRDPTDNEVRIALKNVLKRKADLGKDAVVIAVAYRALLDRIKEFVENPRPNFFESTGFYAGDPVLVTLLFMQQVCIAFQRMETEQKMLFIVGEKEVERDGVMVKEPVFLDEPVMKTMDQVIQLLGQAFEAIKEGADESGSKDAPDGGHRPPDGQGSSGDGPPAPEAAS